MFKVEITVSLHLLTVEEMFMYYRFELQHCISIVFQGILFEGISNIWCTGQQVSSLLPNPSAYGKHCAAFPAFQKPISPQTKTPLHIFVHPGKVGTEFQRIVLTHR